jgi:hypothetical protein
VIKLSMSDTPGCRGKHLSSAPIQMCALPTLRFLHLLHMKSHFLTLGSHGYHPPPSPQSPIPSIRAQAGTGAGEAVGVPRHPAALSRVGRPQAKSSGSQRGSQAQEAVAKTQLGSKHQISTGCKQPCSPLTKPLPGDFDKHLMRQRGS